GRASVDRAALGRGRAGPERDHRVAVLARVRGRHCRRRCRRARARCRRRPPRAGESGVAGDAGQDDRRDGTGAL
ncbi:MAG: hypothetical protein AVDCRST_MAG57-3982, partial [uncultured Blastococcus sp.]